MDDLRRKRVRSKSAFGQKVSKVCYASADVAASSAGSLHALDAYYFLAPFSCWVEAERACWMFPDASNQY